MLRWRYSRPLLALLLLFLAIAPAISGNPLSKPGLQQTLAVAFRAFARHGFDLGFAGHITVRDPELADHFWVNPLAMPFSHIRAADLLLVNEHSSCEKLLNCQLLQ